MNGSSSNYTRKQFIGIQDDVILYILKKFFLVEFKMRLNHIF